MRSNAPSLTVRDVRSSVRPVRLRTPFRFGGVTLAACPQLFVEVDAEVVGAGRATGAAAEMMVPKWFDKRAGRTHAENVADLARSLELATAAYRNDAPASAFGLSARHAAALGESARSEGMTALSAAFGPALLDRAVLDALCRALGVSVFDAMRTNAPGLGDCALAPDLADFDWVSWLARIEAPTSLQARHTVGLLDELGDSGAPSSDSNALPDSLAAAIARYGHRFFKIKLGGSPSGDLARLTEVLALLEREAPGYRFTLDGNEQYAQRDALLELFVGLRALPALAARPGALLYIEQPVPRDGSLDVSLPAAKAPAPLLMDEADDAFDAFARGRSAGWTGVSSKGCKGLYKALLNRARCEVWNRDARPGTRPAFFMSAEDLTCQAGLAVQQDLALAAVLGLTHCERNGHHYVDGFAATPAAEQQAFARMHADLYETTSGHPRLRIEGGAISIRSLGGPGFASLVHPDRSAMQPLALASQFV